MVMSQKVVIVIQRFCGNAQRMLLISILLFTGCGVYAQQSDPNADNVSPTINKSPTITITPSSTSTPTETSTFTPTYTPTQSNTPTPLLFALSATPVPLQLTPITSANAQYVSGLSEWEVSAVTDLSFSVDGSFLAVSDESKIYFYNVYTREIVRTLYPEFSGIIDFEFSPEGDWLVSGSREGSQESGYRSRLELWYGEDYKPLGLLFGNANSLSSMAFSPNGERLFTAYTSPLYQDNYIDFWDVSTWIQTGLLQTGTVLQIGLSQDSTLLATTPGRYSIRVWDLDESIWLPNIYTSFTGAVNKTAFSPTELKLATGHYDGIIAIWDMETGELLHELKSDGVVESLAFSQDGRLLATGNSYENGIISIWDVQTGILLRELDGHRNGVSNLAFSPDGRLLISGSYDGTLRSWGIRP
jgi:WD40 repeat protein